MGWPNILTQIKLLHYSQDLKIYVLCARRLLGNALLSKLHVGLPKDHNYWPHYAQTRVDNLF